MKKLKTCPGRWALAVGAAVVLHTLQGCGQEPAARPAGSPSGGAKGSATSRPLWRMHLAGRAALAQGTNATKLKFIDQLPVSAALRSQIASNLSRAPREFWQKDLPGGVPDAAELWRPLFDDLVQAESILEVRGPVGRTETALAIQLTDERARVWSTNLWRLSGTWKLGEPRAAQLEGAQGWELKRAQAPNLVQFARAGQWVVVGLGQDKLSLAPALLQQVARGGRPAAPPEGVLLDVQADLPGLGAWFPWLTRYGLPPVHVTMRGRGEHVRTEARFQFSTPLTWRPEPWQIPTNMVGEPLTSFTAARGVSSLLKSIPNIDRLSLEPFPSQLCAWGVSNDQCRVYLATPHPNPAAAISRIALGLPPLILTNLGQVMGDFFYLSNRTYFTWRNVPFIQPYVQVITNAGQQFIHAGVLPLPPRQVPAPPDLFNQLGTRTDLVYYDWEITPQRIWNGRLCFDLINILSKRYPQPSTTSSKAWLAAVMPELWKDASNPSQTVTEISQSAPNELFLVRKSHLGFTGIEMAGLSRWLDSPGFPFRYVPPGLVGTGRTNHPAGAGLKAPAPDARPPTVPAPKPNP